MREEALPDFRFSRYPELTLVRSKIGLLISINALCLPIPLISSPKIALKPAFFEVAKGQLLDTLLIYQGLRSCLSSYSKVAGYA